MLQITCYYSTPQSTVFRVLLITGIVICTVQPIDSFKGIPYGQKYSSVANTISDDETYPANEIDDAMNKSNGKFNAFIGSDISTTADQLTNRFQDLEGTCRTFLCESDLKLDRPRTGKTENNTTVTIVNTDTYGQGVQVELCRKPHQPCKNYQGKRKTMCVQTSYYRNVLAFDPVKNKIYVEKVLVLYGCKCAELTN